MVFEVRPYPEFSWSISRQRLLDQCPRAYYLRYYLSWNGWLREAPERARLAYRLSKLTSLDALLGQEMDERAREVETCCRGGRSLPTAEALEERTRKVLRAAWRSSRRRTDFEQKPKDHLMLRSFYLDGCPPPETETDRINEKLPCCTANLLAVDHWERLRACAGEGCVLIPDFAHFFLDGVKVYAAADLAYVHDDTLHVIDWKSGRSGPDDALQVVLATFCLLQTDPALEGCDVRAGLHYLLAGEARPVTLPQDHEGVVTATVAAGVKAMRARLRDVKENAPLDEGEFERRESGLCRSCNFTPLCEQGWA